MLYPDGTRLMIDECLDKLKQKYDGYRFNQDGEAVFNPISLLNAVFDGDFGAYWFETGTPVG